MKRMQLLSGLGSMIIMCAVMSCSKEKMAAPTVAKQVSAKTTHVMSTSSAYWNYAQ